MNDQRPNLRQIDIAQHLDLSDRSVREFLSLRNIDHKASTLDEIRIAYIRHLREIAAGRAALGDIDLATERALLAREQREKIAMQNAVARKEYAPVIVIEQVLSRAGSRVAGILDSITGAIRRRNLALTAQDLELIDGEIARARNLAASVSLADLLDETAEEPSPEPAPEILEGIDA